MKKLYQSMSFILSVGLFCPQAFSAQQNQSAEMQKLNYFAAAVAEDAIAAFKLGDMEKFAFRLGYPGKADAELINRQFARRSVKELPAVQYENGNMLFKFQGYEVAIQILDATAKNITINGVPFVLKEGKTLTQSYEMNFEAFSKTIEKSLASNSLLQAVVPEAKANVWGWVAGLSLVGIPLLLAIGKSESIKEGFKSYGQRVKKLGKAVFWEGPKQLLKGKVGDSFKTVGDGIENLFKGNHTDK